MHWKQLLWCVIALNITEVKHATSVMIKLHCCPYFTMIPQYFPLSTVAPRHGWVPGTDGDRKSHSTVPGEWGWRGHCCWWRGWKRRKLWRWSVRKVHEEVRSRIWNYLAQTNWAGRVIRWKQTPKQEQCWELTLICKSTVGSLTTAFRFS